MAILKSLSKLTIYACEDCGAESSAFRPSQLPPTKAFRLVIFRSRCFDCKMWEKGP